ncbi:MAG: cupin domain-containing protein [Vicingaceae bacterium]
MTKKQWVEHLQLLPHPEGGFYRETYRSKTKIDLEGVGQRNLSTGIYFLLEEGNFSAFHRIKSDEMWHYYAGDPLIVHMIDVDGNYTNQKIGNDFLNNELPQFVVPAGIWFASEVVQGGCFSLVGCTVSFGFDFQDFELADSRFMDKFTSHRDIIKRLIR